MKKINYLMMVCFLILGTTLMSCKKEGCTDPLATNYSSEANKDDGSCTYPEATLTIESPTNGQAYMGGDTIMIHANASNYEEMHGWELYLLNTTTGDTVYTNHMHDHATEYHIMESWVNNVTVHSDMVLGVTVVINHEGKTLFKKVNFHCMP